ncbi:uncharacterized protein [Henckelia pumila]|uniref:uncharacterized protein n=1 Tax=Henckelia pumila TaxID=405737 RepID=UPI003C6E835B
MESAKKGDVHTLHNLINDDPLASRPATILFDGDSPLHIASADGNLDIVKELLKVGCHLCFVKGKDGRIPLHHAVCKGRKQVIRELISYSLESIEETTARGENCFHLAITNNQFEAFKELLDFVVRHEKGEILKKKDRRGNNLFHFAAYGKQYEVFDLLLDENFHYKGILDEINSLNKSGLTPLDVLLSNGASVDRQLEEMVRASGGKRVKEIQATLSQQNSTVPSHNSSQEQQHISRDRPQSTSGKLLEYFKFKNFNESPSKVRATLLLLAVLIATTTYQAALSPPGGVWQDDSWPQLADPIHTHLPHDHSAGKAVMGTNNPGLFAIFMLFNSIGFFMSMEIIYGLTSGIPMQFLIRVSLFIMALTYQNCMINIAPGGILTLFLVVISIALTQMMPRLTMAL